MADFNMVTDQGRFLDSEGELRSAEKAPYNQEPQITPKRDLKALFCSALAFQKSPTSPRHHPIMALEEM